jgi:NAD(P)-dependent dehydrogenase (short-subunit alcohol dehydrogenase family)
MSNRDRQPKDRACIVVGVGEGLGAALARRFAEDYKVALVARSAEVIDRTADEIRSEGGIALPIQSDATIESQIKETYERVTRELGPVEVLIYNGGRRPIGRLMETTPEVFESTWRLHTFGAFLWSRQVVPAMLERGSGTILITGATAGIRPWPNSAGFAPAKFAVRGLAQVMARDLHPAGHPRRLRERGWRDRYAALAQVSSRCERRKPAEARRDRRRLLVSGSSGSQHLDS